MSYAPTIFHITHPKAGSQWVKKILYEIAPKRTRMDADEYPSYFFFEPIHQGKIYPTIYTSKDTFDAVLHFRSNSQNLNFVKTQAKFINRTWIYMANWVRFSLLRQPYKKFFVIRDLRDTLISFYFSMKKTHLLMTDYHSIYRTSLNQLSEEDGLLYLMDTLEFSDYARMQLSWMQDPDTLIIHFEDIIQNPFLFEKIVEHCEIEVDRKILRDVLVNNSFKNLSGRNRGDEDQSSHFRKGIAGDWVNYFKPAVKDEFKKKYGHVLTATMYENRVDW